MFDNKIISIITRTLGAIFLLILSCLIINGVINIIVLYNLQTVTLIILGFIIHLTVVAIICICIGEFIVWIVDKIYK